MLLISHHQLFTVNEASPTLITGVYGTHFPYMLLKLAFGQACVKCVHISERAAPLVLISVACLASTIC